MLAIDGTHGRANVRTCEGLSRRSVLTAGGLGILGLNSCPAQAIAAGRPRRARSLVILDLYGGPAHQDIFDLKPDAPSEIRGEFKPIRTSVPGLELGEHVPGLGSVAHLYTLVRSMTHTDTEHATGGYTVLTGVPHPRPGTILPPSPDDFPPIGSVVSALRPTQSLVPGYVALGGTMFSAGGDVPGQTGGLAGQKFDPFDVRGDPSKPDFKVRELSLAPDVTRLRLGRRATLLDQVEQAARLKERSRGAGGFGDLQGRAFDLLGSSLARTAFDLTQEADSVRNDYGRYRFGQSCLLARRLVERGVPVVAVYWDRGQVWDTHGNNFKDLKDRLLPPMDRTVTAMLKDLHQRGLLDETILLVTGEFGRTPRINSGAGRDHWPGVYTSLVAGGGFPRGFVYGASDEQAAYPSRDPVHPWDLAATIYHLLGIDPETAEITDRQNRPIRVCPGTVVQGLLA